MACGLHLAFLVLAVFLGCGSVSPACTGSFSHPSWPSSPRIIDIWDANATLVGRFPNLTLTYDGRPFFFRFRNVTGTGRWGRLMLTLPPKMMVIFTSLFPGQPMGISAANFSLGVIRIPHIFDSSFFIHDVVLYLERFVAVDIDIPRLRTYSISFEYGD